MKVDCNVANISLTNRQTNRQTDKDVDYHLNNNSNTIRDRARLHSQVEKLKLGCQQIPFSSHVALPPHNFRLATMMRLGCGIPASSSCCDCGKELDI